MTRFDAERLYVRAAHGLFAPSGVPARSPERRFVQITVVFFNMPMLTIDTLESANPAETAKSVRAASVNYRESVEMCRHLRSEFHA
jgi:hypothetical protein